MAHRILIVDDEEQVRHLLRQTMELAGHDVDEAADGKEAIQKLGEGSFDLVIVDIIMPEQDGLEVIMFLRKAHPQVKIIAISGLGDKPYLTSARALGAAQVLTKPFEMAEMAAAVNRLLAPQTA